MRTFKWLGCVIVLTAAVGGALVSGVQLSAAQGNGQSCLAAVAQVIAAVQGICDDLPPNTVCAGTAGVRVLSQAGETVAPASRMPLVGLSAITTDPYSLTGGELGVSVLTVPGVSAGESLTAVLFGAATLTNVPGQPLAPACSATSIGSVNIRAEPNTSAAILGQLDLDESAPVTARLPDSSWWRILWNGAAAWVFAQLAPAGCDPAAMLVYDPVSGEVSGGLPAPDFQNVQITTDFSALACAGAPRGGLLLQSDTAGAAWIVNGLLLDLNGTALLQAGGNDVLAVQVLTGQVALEAGGVTRLAAAGQLLRVPLQDGRLQSLPGPALDAVLPGVADAPLTLLPRPVIAPAVTHEVPALPAGADIACDLLPQSMMVMAEGTTAVLRVYAKGDQTIRVSVSGGDLRSLSVDTPAGSNVMLSGPDGSPAETTVLTTDLVVDQGGGYAFRVETTSGTPVRFGVTCGLPQPAPPPTLQACESVLMRWETVSGNSVRFTAPQDAQVSVIARHELPSQGPAAILGVFTETGEQVGQAAFMGFQARRVAGPLDILLPRQATYVIRWDGDPFNLMDVEALCVPPVSQVPAG